MSLFQTWIYQNILNTEWMIWIVVAIVFGFNFLAPIFVYYALAEKKMNFKVIKKIRNKTTKNETTGS